MTLFWGFQHPQHHLKRPRDNVKLFLCTAKYTIESVCVSVRPSVGTITFEDSNRSRWNFLCCISSSKPRLISQMGSIGSHLRELYQKLRFSPVPPQGWSFEKKFFSKKSSKYTSFDSVFDADSKYIRFVTSKLHVHGKTRETRVRNSRKAAKNIAIIWNFCHHENTFNEKQPNICNQRRISNRMIYFSKKLEKKKILYPTGRK